MKRVNLRLSTKSINEAITQLEYIKQGIHNIPKRIVEQLLRIGIRTANENTGKYAGYIKFETRVEESEDGYVGLLVARDGQKVVSRWRRGGELIEVEVSPMLMAEFGSGWYANVVPGLWDDIAGEVGQGTFKDPKSGYEQRHAFDPRGWGWTDENGALHRSQGEAPTYPLYTSWLEMEQAINGVVKSAIQFYFA